MQMRPWAKALLACADSSRARQFLEALGSGECAAWVRDADEGQRHILCALLAGSQALGEALVAAPARYLPALTSDHLTRPRLLQGILREARQRVDARRKQDDFNGALRDLREWKQVEMTRIAARDLAGLGSLMEIVGELSHVADVCLGLVFELVWERQVRRLGQPWHATPDGAWSATECCVFGLGKLGGQELNYSSDVDVIIVYSEEGTVAREQPARGTQPKSGLANHTFFTRLGEAYLEEIRRLTPEGNFYRIDLRLRPEGNAGPLVRSLDSYENYYAQWGQTWERMMLIKARRVAGSVNLAGEFLEMIQPFRYPRAIGERIPHEVAAMKDRIEQEVVGESELERNVKLGRGGIREIEFLVQTQQVLQGGRQPFLQHTQTLPTLDKLAAYGLMPEEETQVLTRAYEFLRNTEHRLQMENNLQTHSLPTTDPARRRLAALMGFDSWRTFLTELNRHRRRVRQSYDRILRPEEPEPVAAGLPRQFDGQETTWKELLARHGFRDLDRSFPLVRGLVMGPGYVHVSARTVELSRELFPRFLKLCPDTGKPPRGARLKQPVLSDPDRVLARLDSFVTAYGARATMYEIWTRQPQIFELLIWLFDCSEHLAEVAIRTPDLVDELTLSGRLNRAKTAADIYQDLSYGLKDEDQLLWIRRYHEAEQMRIGLRDIFGLADFEQNQAELSALAEACLQYALVSVLRRHRIRRAPFAILGLGKLGGNEINYGSDLDLVFVANQGARDLPKLQKIAAEVMDLLSRQTEAGRVFETDARLRPDGDGGLLVNTLDAFEDYLRRRARLWEIQSFSRTRFIAGQEETGRDFLQLLGSLADFTPAHTKAGFPLRKPGRKGQAKGPGLSAWSPEWKREIAEMRQRIETERTPRGKDALAIKTGRGGLIDAEFIAQAACLENGWVEPGTRAALQRIRDSGWLPAQAADSLLENYRELHRVEGILRRWSFAGETLLPDDPAPLHRVAIRCGYRDADAFLKAIAGWRKKIRTIYSKVFPKL